MISHDGMIYGECVCCRHGICFFQRPLNKTLTRGYCAKQGPGQWHRTLLVVRGFCRGGRVAKRLAHEDFHLPDTV